MVSLDQVPCDSFLGRMDPQAVMVHRTYAVERSFFQLLDFHWKENLLCVLRRERFPFLFLDGNHFLLLKLGSRRHSVEYFMSNFCKIICTSYKYTKERLIRIYNTLQLVLFYSNCKIRESNTYHRSIHKLILQHMSKLTFSNKALLFNGWLVSPYANIINCLVKARRNTNIFTDGAI